LILSKNPNAPSLKNKKQVFEKPAFRFHDFGKWMFHLEAETRKKEKGIPNGTLITSGVPKAPL